jgi:ABC-type amino acid transport substrate-binding protein
MTGSARVAALCGLLLALLLAACEAESTPLPAFVAATPTDAPATPTRGPLRYALTAGTEPNSADLALLQASAQIVALDPEDTPELGSQYELIAGYGDREGWTRSPVVPRVSLAVAPRRPPLDQPDIAALLLGVLDAQALVGTSHLGGSEALLPTVDTPATRTLLANAGWPDGFDVALAHASLPGAEAVAAQLSALGIQTSLVTIPPDALLPALADGRANLALLTWTYDDERAALVAAVGADRLIDLYTLPITFQAVDGLRLSFTPGGWPLVSR